ncbi:MAG TPA: RtcB family protein [Spirochaetota bacterium]|jgi:RNA-splicing ligase RtcB|nr:MAG: RNA-splicing ligase RtcB [Spirochaetes bacterium ADurb.Bin133]HNZ25750.1 RtcB family protein [Spirochaetota bacterium]HPY87227.1 RtcB family protein [Spirochaetota bacterium]
MTIQGKYNSAEIFTDNIDEESIKQIHSILNNPGFADSQIRIMPDVHAGKGSVIGFTMTFNNYVAPTIVGVDIGCGMNAYKIGKREIDLKSLDKFIHKAIPAGKEVRSSPVENPLLESEDLKRLVKKVADDDYDRVARSIGSLGGGNHFIELNRDTEDNIWLATHSGSRNLGLKVCSYHQNKAKEYIRKKFGGSAAYNNAEFMPMNDGGSEYLDDMKLTQEYALQNRYTICTIILEEFFGEKIKNCESIISVHNYINFKDKIVRKGAISAHDGERIIIPLNMRDGSIVARGKGNKNWNYSAPHGAGRILSRSGAKKTVSLEEYIKTMKSVYTSSVNKSTIDESPMAYKPSKEIIRLIKDTADIDFVMKPIYNFKSCE